MTRWTLMIVLALLPAAASAQLHFGLYTSSMYDDNSFSIYEKRADVYHSLFGALSADAKLGRYGYMQGYYYGAIVLFRTFEDRTYNIHTLGAYTQIQLNYREDEPEEQGDTDTGDNDAEEHSGPAPPSLRLAQEEPVFNDSLVSWLFVIPQVGARFDKERWNFYDFQRGSLLLKWNRPLFGSLASQLLYHIEYKYYPHLEQFTHIEQIGGLNLNHELSRRLEVFGSVNYGYKSYTETIVDTLDPEEGGDGSVTQLTTPATSQVELSAGMVYQLFPQAPLAFSYLLRLNPMNTARYVDQGPIIGSTEDEIFDDRYGYEGHEFRLQLDGLLPGSIRTTNAVQYVLKDYPREATDLNGIPFEGKPMRADKRFVLQLQALYPLFRSSEGSGLSIGLAYNFIRNESNDSYHNYNVHQVALVLSGDW